MKCKICSKILISQIKCHLCNNFFCSNYCLESHFHLYHKSLNLSKNRIYEKPKIEREKNNNNLILYSISSPYITNGYISNQINYEEIYDLKNFIQVLEYNSPKIIGIGSYGKVYLYRNITDKKLYAIKHLNKMILCKSIHNIKRIYDEINIQSRIYHQNIVRLLNVKENEDNIYLIMEYASNGSLYQYIRKKKYLSEEESFKFFSQIINAIYFLHKNDFIHRDIKPENILIFNDDICKICDFGCCVELNGKQRTTFCGTTEYMSPEIVNKIEYSKEIDIWSLGILLYEMIHGYSPFNPNNKIVNSKEVINKIKVNDIKFNLNISKECKDLICHLLDKNAKNRYKIEDIFKSEFIKKYQKMNLFFLNEKYNNKSENKNNYTDIKMNNNTLLLSTLVENDYIINKTLFNNNKYNSPDRPIIKNKINNVIFNNVINRNPNNKNLFSDKTKKKLITTREENKKINFFKNDSFSSSQDELEINNQRNKKITVKVTKLSSESYILNDYLKSNISNVKKINNEYNLYKESSISNNFSINNSNILSENNLKNKYHSVKRKDNKINELSQSFIKIDINKETNLESNRNYKKLISKTARKKEKNFIFERKDDRIESKKNENNKKYYIKPKIEKEYLFPKDNSKEVDKQKKNVIDFKNCVNSKIKIPRRKILSSLQLDNIHLINNLDELNINTEIQSLNSSNQLNTELFEMKEKQKELSFQNNINKINPNNRYDSYINDYSINTQINKNYIFNPNISINFPKYSFSNEKSNHKNTKKMKIVEIKEDIKDRIISPINLSKSIFSQKNILSKNIKNNSINNSKNKNKNLLFEQTYQPKIKDNYNNISPSKCKIKKEKNAIFSKSLPHINEKIKHSEDDEWELKILKTKNRLKPKKTNEK